MANFISNAFKSLGGLFKGTPEKHQRVSTLTKYQQPILKQNIAAAKGPGAGGAFGEAADYYRSILENNPEALEEFMAPENRRFNEDIIPGLAEQFAGMGSGGLTSSSFRNAAVNAGTDLSERLGAIRAQLRQNSAGSLAAIGQNALGNYSQDVMTQPGSEGLISQAAPIIGTAAGMYFGGPAGAQIGAQLGNQFRNSFNSPKVGRNTSPYGRQQNGFQQQSGFQLPNFNPGMR